MGTGIPPNFEKHWEGANIILRAQNSDGKELHANKKTLGEKSTYFNAMFFSGFKEAYEDDVEVPCSYKCMLNILRTIHNGRGRLICASTVEDLVEIYHAADMFDIPSITSIYFEDFGADTTMAVTAVELGNRDMLMNRLEKMSGDELRLFIRMKNTISMFSKKDAVFVYEKIENKKLKKDLFTICESPHRYSPPKFSKIKRAKECRSSSLEDLILHGSVKIDLSKKSQASDVAISTKNGKVLYVKKEIIPKFSEKFHKMFITSNESSEGTTDPESIHVHVEYTLMKPIIHILYDEYDFDDAYFATFLLYDMHRFAAEFDMPVIMNFIPDRLVKQATAGCLDLAIKLGLQNLVPQILDKMSPVELRIWLLSEDDRFVHRKDDEEIMISSKSTDLNLSLNDLRSIFIKFHAENERKRKGPRRWR